MALVNITNQTTPSTPASGTTYVYIDSADKILKTKDDAGVIRSATGDVNGPASSINNNLASFNGTTGKVIKDSGIAVSGSTLTASVTGNAGTATALQTPRTINGVSFDGTANITNAVPVGTPMQEVVGTYTANTNLTATIPSDDTIPQNTEGTEIISVSITPSSTSSKLRVTFTGFCATNTNNRDVVIALFMDTTANALYATACHGQANRAINASFVYEFTPATTSAVTMKLRVGPESADTLRFNGSTTARYFGGVAVASMIVQELKG